MYRVHKARTIASTLRSVRDFQDTIVQAHASKLIRNFQVQALALLRTGARTCLLRGAAGGTK